MTPEQVLDCITWLTGSATCARVFVQCFTRKYDKEWMERFIETEVGRVFPPQRKVAGYER